MKVIPTALLTGILCFSPILIGRQAAAQEPVPAQMEQGFEPLVTAIEALKSCKSLDTADEPGMTLTQKRMIISDPSVRQALEQIHLWLANPPQIADFDDTVTVGLRAKPVSIIAVGKGLAVRNYVLLADGRTGDAIAALGDGLRLSYIIGNGNMMGRLSGIVVETTLIQSLVTHLDQFSARDSDRLFQLAKEWEKTPEPLPKILERARRAKLAQIQKLLLPEEFTNLIHELAGRDEDKALAVSLQSLTPEAWQQVIAHSIVSINSTYEQAEFALEKPYWERTQEAPSEEFASKSDDPIAKQLVDRALPNLDRTGDILTKEKAVIRLLGCYSAIQRYKWEHDRLPPSLAELKIGEMTVDPFTGKAFIYRIEGKNYMLESAGPRVRDVRGHIQGDQSIPLTLLPGITGQMR